MKFSEIRLETAVNRPSDVNMIIHGLLYNREAIPLPIKTLRRHMQKHRSSECSNTLVPNKLVSNKLKSGKDKISKFINGVTEFSNEVELMRNPKWIFVGFGSSRYSLKEVYLIDYENQKRRKNNEENMEKPKNSLIQNMVEYFFQLEKPRVGNNMFLHMNNSGDHEVPFKIGHSTRFYRIDINKSENSKKYENKDFQFQFNPSILPDSSLSKVKKLPQNQHDKQGSKQAKFCAKIDFD